MYRLVTSIETRIALVGTLAFFLKLMKSVERYGYITGSLTFSDVKISVLIFRTFDFKYSFYLILEKNSDKNFGH